MAEKYYTPKSTSSVFKTPASKYYTPRKETSDSEESTNGEGAASSDSGGSGDLSLVAEFDELLRLTRQQRNDEVEDAFLNFVQQMIPVVEKLNTTEQECVRLQGELDERTHSLSELESKLLLARKLLDQERRHSRKVQDEREELREQIARVHEFLFQNGRGRLQDDAKEKLPFLNRGPGSAWDPNAGPGAPHPLSIIKEGNTTGSLLSEFSYSRSEDDLNISDFLSDKKWTKHRPSDGAQHGPAFKKRKSSNSKVVEITNTDSVRATTTLTVPKHGPITATSIIESVPIQSDADGRTGEETPTNRPSARPAGLFEATPKGDGKSNLRQHSFQQKTVVMPETCGPCEKRIRFGMKALKCKECRAMCHPECREDLPLPCIPFVSTPPIKHMMGFISDYTPTTPPMVPAIIVHCLNEIELRGLTEIGIYRIPGAERDVKQLKEKFLRGKGYPCLNQVPDIHVICGTVKDFLRSLQEPLITFGLWPSFVKCVESQEDPTTLYSIISNLPQPNRDTLAYMILHLQRVGNSLECKMPISNLAKIFGPTIVGYSSADPSPQGLITETRQQNMVMETLMNLPRDYWASLVNVPEMLRVPKLQQTPSTDSLLRSGNTPFITPYTAKRLARKKKRIFPSPTFK